MLRMEWTEETQFGTGSVNISFPTCLLVFSPNPCILIHVVFTCQRTGPRFLQHPAIYIRTHKQKNSGLSLSSPTVRLPSLPPPLRYSSNLPAPTQNLASQKVPTSGTPPNHSVLTCRRWGLGLLTRQSPGPIRGGLVLERRQSALEGSSGRSCTWRRWITQWSGGFFHQSECAEAGRRPIGREGKGWAGFNLAAGV